jgi:hypothetical protein
MTSPARSTHLLPEAEYRDEGEALLQAPGDAVLVRRGGLRSVLMRCPDGCGETLVVNLDPRAGKAWRLYMRGGNLTLFPSFWRDGGCCSHFIVWRGKILWCGRFEDRNMEPACNAALETRVLATLRKGKLRSAEDVAAELDEIPWEVMRAGRALLRQGLAVSGAPKLPDWFALPDARQGEN